MQIVQPFELLNMEEPPVCTDVGACRAVPQVSNLTQVLRQVVLVVGLSGQLQVTTERVQPHWVSPVEAHSNASSTAALTIDCICRYSVRTLTTFLNVRLLINRVKKILK